MGSDKPPFKVLTTDSGPQKLALGSSTVPRESYVRDLCHMVDAFLHHRVKVIISSAGRDGSDEHVDGFVVLFGPTDIVRRALDAKKISPCGSSVLEMRSEDGKDAVRIVTSTNSTSNTEILAKLLAQGDGLQDGLISLPSLAEFLLSKLVGPFKISFDIIFYDLACFERAKNSGQLTPEKIALLYGVNIVDKIACQFFRQAEASKCTIPRVGKTGGLGDQDLHASQQHVPLMGIRV